MKKVIILLIVSLSILLLFSFTGVAQDSQNTAELDADVIANTDIVPDGDIVVSNEREEAYLIDRETQDLVAISQTGGEKWRWTPDGEITGDQIVISQDNDYIYLIIGNDSDADTYYDDYILHAINITENPSTEWTKEVPIPGSPTAANGQVYAWTEIDNTAVEEDASNNNVRYREDEVETSYSTEINQTLNESPSTILGETKLHLTETDSSSAIYMIENRNGKVGPITVAENSSVEVELVGGNLIELNTSEVDGDRAITSVDGEFNVTNKLTALNQTTGEENWGTIYDENDHRLCRTPEQDPDSSITWTTPEFVDRPGCSITHRVYEHSPGYIDDVGPNIGVDDTVLRINKDDGSKSGSLQRYWDDSTDSPHAIGDLWYHVSWQADFDDEGRISPRFDQVPEYHIGNDNVGYIGGDSASGTIVMDDIFTSAEVTPQGSSYRTTTPIGNETFAYADDDGIDYRHYDDSDPIPRRSSERNDNVAEYSEFNISSDYSFEREPVPLGDEDAIFVGFNEFTNEIGVIKSVYQTVPREDSPGFAYDQQLEFTSAGQVSGEISSEGDISMNGNVIFYPTDQGIYHIRTNENSKDSQRNDYYSTTYGGPDGYVEGIMFNSETLIINDVVGQTDGSEINSYSRQLTDDICVLDQNMTCIDN